MSKNLANSCFTWMKMLTFGIKKGFFFFSIHQHSMPFRVLILAWEEEEEEWKQKKQVAVLQ